MYPDYRNSRVDRVRLSIKVLEGVAMGVYKMSSSRVESLRVDTTCICKSRVVNRVRLSIKVLEVVVVGVYKMSSSCVESLRVHTTRHL